MVPESSDTNLEETHEWLKKIERSWRANCEQLIGVDLYPKEAENGKILDWVSSIIAHKECFDVRDKLSRGVVAERLDCRSLTFSELQKVWIKREVGTGKTILTSTVI